MGCIARARVYAVHGGLGAPVENAGESWRERRFLLLELTDEAGRIGQGEASPLPGFSRDTLDQARGELLQVDWTALPELDPAEAACGQIEARLELTGVHAPAARFAVETALFDLAGQALAKPVSELLDGPIPDSSRDAWPPVALAALLTGDVLTAAQERVDHGYRHFKLKVGRSPPEDLALLASLRAQLGPDIALRADANGSFAPEAAPTWLRSAAALDLEFLEEPVPLGRLKPAEPSPVPLAIDESLRPGDETGLLSALATGAYRFVVLKPSYHGGLVRCQRLARLARRHGAEPVVSHLFEGPVALAAAAELALALAPCPAAGLAPHAGLDLWPNVGLAAFHQADLVRHHSPGLGLPPLADLFAGQPQSGFTEVRR